MKKVLLVFGTRPEAIKMAPLIKELEKYPDSFEVFVCVTGQHREMLDQVLKLYDIIPEFDLDIMRPGQDLYDITSRILLGLRSILTEVMPDIVLVHGDTTTSMATSLAAYYARIKVGHVEAGLRTYNIYSPWPEEINRQITGRIAAYHFAPTQTSRENLLGEKIPDENIFVTGNTVIDSLLYITQKLETEKNIQNQVFGELQQYGLPDFTSSEWKENRKLILITGHRRENFGQGLLNICHAIKNLAAEYPDVDFVYPVHLNPQVKGPVYEILNHSENIYLTNPLDYLPFVCLMKTSYLILTDSGGIQEEAPGLGIPVLVMRDTTERPEAVQAGTVKLVGTDMDNIINSTRELLDNKEVYLKMSQAINPYGNGEASAKIVKILQTGL